jgi:hypothetical protein
MECTLKHAKYEPKDEEWKCPNCGETDEDYFFIEESASDGECHLLHEKDLILCNRCGWSGTGKQFSSILIKKANSVQCPMCKGTGLVQKGKQCS